MLSKSFVTACAAFSAFLLSGCSSKSALQFRPTMGSDRAAIGIEALGYLNNLQSAYEYGTGCLINSVPSLQNVESEPFKRLKKPGESDESALRRLGCLRLKDGTPTEAKRHLDWGIALANIYCDDYFRRIAVRKQTRQFGRSTTNDVGTAASVGLGLAQAGSILTGGAGALFGLADGIFRNYDTAFVVEPDLGKMLKLVQTAQGTMSANFKTSPPETYAQANAAIASYAQLCSYSGMDNLLDEALEAGTTPETIEQAVARFQTTASGLKKSKQERVAESLESQIAGLERQKAALEKKKALEEEIRKAQEPAQPIEP